MILDALARQQISLSVAGKLAPHLKTGNCERLISDCTGMTTREVERYLVHLAPKPAVDPGARRRPTPAPGRATATARPVDDDEGRADAELVPPTTQPAPAQAPVKPGSAEPCQPDLFNFRFAADQGFMDKLERAGEVSGVGDARCAMVQILERGLDELLEKHDPRRRQERREKRASQMAHAKVEAEIEVEAKVEAEVEVEAKVEGTAKSEIEAELETQMITAEPVTLTDPRRARARSRFIPAPLRDQLLIQSGHRCEYRGSDSLRCSERSRLAIDHIEPWGLGGTSEARNLRVLCFAHNRLHADRCFGPEFMNQKIEAARFMSAQEAVSNKPRADEVANPIRVRESATIYRTSGIAKRHQLAATGAALPRPRGTEPDCRNRPAPVRRSTECSGGLVGQGQS
jgi:hypothetical protein